MLCSAQGENDVLSGYAMVLTFAFDLIRFE